MAALSISSSPITQVSQTPAHANLQPQLLTRLLLDLRGRRFSVDRETIMNLPESVLLCLFPDGLVLSRQSAALSDGGENEKEDELYGVDVRAALLILLFFFFFCRAIDLLSSSTQAVFHTSCLSFGTHQRRSMVQA